MTPKSKKIFGIVLVCSPLLLPVTLSLYAIMSFVTRQILASGNEGNATLFALIQMLLSLLGLLGLLGIFIGIPVGIYLLVTANKK